jgi:hypothetical protein
MDSRILVLVGAAVIVAGIAFIKRLKWSLSEKVGFLALGAGLITLVLLDFMGFMAPKWVYIFWDVVMGSAFILKGIVELYSPPSLKYPRCTQWVTLAVGVGFIFLALIKVFDLFHS